MILLWLFAQNAAAAWEFPDLKLGASGILGWSNLLQKLASQFNGMEIAGYKLVSEFDIPKYMRHAGEKLLREELPINGMIAEFVNGLPLEINVSDMDNISFSVNANFDKYSVDLYIEDAMKTFMEDFTQGQDVESSTFYFGVLIGEAFACLILVILFVFCLLLFLYLCFSCCCSKKIDNEKPGIGLMIFFYIGVACIALVAIFALCVIPNLMNVKNTVVNLPEIISQIAIDGEDTFTRLENKLQGDLNQIIDYVFTLPDKLETMIEKMTNSINGYINKIGEFIIESPDGQVPSTSLFATFYDGGSINQTLERINQAIDDLPESSPTAVYQKPDKIYLYDDIEIARTMFRDLLEDIPDAFNSTISMFSDMIPNFKEMIDDGSINESLNLREAFASIHEWTAKYKDSDKVLEQIFGKSTSEDVEKVFDYINQYFPLVIVLVCLVAAFYISIVVCFAFTFHNKCCCCKCCCSTCACCFPCCQLIFLLIIGAISTVFAIVYVLISANIQPGVDSLVDSVVNFIDQRTIILPSIKLTLYSNNERRQIQTTQLNMTFANPTTPLKYFLDAEKETGLSDVFGLKEFLQLDIISKDFTFWPEQLNPMLSDLLGDVVGPMVDDFSEFIVNADSLHNIEGVTIPDYDTMINDAITQIDKAIEDLQPFTLLPNSNAKEIIALLQDLRVIVIDLRDNQIPDLEQSFIDNKNYIVDELVNKLNSKGFGQFYNDSMHSTMADIFDFLCNEVSVIVNLIPDAINEIRVNLVRGPLGQFSNIIFVDLSSFAAYTTISVHISLLGYFIVCLAMRIRNKHLSDRDASNTDDSEENELEEMENAVHTRKRNNSRQDDQSGYTSRPRRPRRTRRSRRRYDSSSSSTTTTSSSNSDYAASKRTDSNPQPNKESFWLNY